MDKRWSTDFTDRLNTHETKVNTLLNELILKIPDNSCVIDAGVHVGDTLTPLSYTAIKNNKDITIYGIDPDKTKISFINDVCDLNNLTNVKTIIGGLSNKGGNGSIKILDHIPHAGAWVVDDTGNDFNIYTIDQLFKNNKVSLIHLDVEGYEYKSLLGATEILRKYKPFLVIEILHGNDKDNIIPFLKGLGYKGEQIDETNYLFE
jgi:FkbM family methyltransferase